MKSVAKVPVIAKPNAGLPTIDEQGEAHYSMGPEQFVQHMQKLVDCGAGIIGGCCGTTPDYIRLLAEKIK
jgi:5-methyltetrahydrofolate--homocysteine methyltransferase